MLKTEAVLDYTYAGFARMVAIVAAWVGLSCFTLFGVTLSGSNWWWLALAIPLQTFLNVGLFISAHDAMHGLLLPKHPWGNEFCGRLCTSLYALFDYDRLRIAHHEHHRAPVSGDDPDYHRGGSERFWPWYFSFMAGYAGPRQWLGMPVEFAILWYCGAPLANLFLGLATPAILSSLQLFYFGTYLPHRTPAGGHEEPHRATTSGFGRGLSFATCYHFGYHREHHAFPWIPWWKLGRLQREAAAALTNAGPARGEEWKSET
ncbi:MAG TPA: fatty acid desaturase [Planctomycetia bacterium]|nr:fatty acid desaturase [Planctomycetia bacterium]